MAVRQYIGARYVPVFYKNANNTAEWTENTIYEPLTIVTYGTNSYTSKRTVPASVGNPYNNPDYWVATGNFNAQLQEAIEEIREFEKSVDEKLKASENAVSIIERFNSGLAIAHRGYTLGSSPNDIDNSPISVRDAAYNGFNGIEIDLRKDKNGVIVCLHDDNVSSVCIQSGSITEYAYTECKLKNKFGSETEFHLMSLSELIALAKFYKLFVMFDMWTQTVEIHEVVAVCESLNFKNYGFINTVREQSDQIPEYAVFVPYTLDPTEEQIVEWINNRGSATNIYILISSWSAGKQEIADRLGVGFAINQASVTHPAAPYAYINIYANEIVDAANKPQAIYSVTSDKTIAECADAIPDSSNKYPTVTVFQWTHKNNGEDNALSGNWIVTVYKPSINYITVKAINADGEDNRIFVKRKRGGVWSSWIIGNLGGLNEANIPQGTTVSSVADTIQPGITVTSQKIYSPNDGDSVLGGNSVVTIYKFSDAYIYIEAKRFGSPAITYTKTKSGGTWGEWTSV